MYFNVANSTGAQCNCLSCGQGDFCSILCVPGPAFPSTEPTAVPISQGSTCAETKAAYKSSSCCNQTNTTFANYSQCGDYKATNICSLELLLRRVLRKKSATKMWNCSQQLLLFGGVFTTSELVSFGSKPSNNLYLTILSRSGYISSGQDLSNGMRHAVPID